jgi:hypothetical protein
MQKYAREDIRMKRLAMDDLRVFGTGMVGANSKHTLREHGFSFEVICISCNMTGQHGHRIGRTYVALKG